MDNKWQKIMDFGKISISSVAKQRKELQTSLFLKEATVIVNLMDIRDAKVEDIIEAVTEKIGFGKLLAVRPRPDRKYELTLDDEGMCDDLMDGLMIKEKM